MVVEARSERVKRYFEASTSYTCRTDSSIALLIRQLVSSLGNQHT